MGQELDSEEWLMEQSHRRHERTKEWLSARVVKRPALVAAALVAAAGALLFFDNVHDAADADAFSALIGCEEQSMSMPGCYSSTTIAPAPVIQTTGWQDLPVPGPSPDRRDRSPRRAWQQENNNSSLEPEYTLVEVCAKSPDLAVTHCRAHTTTELHARIKADASNDDKAGFLISGRVLSADGESLEGVSVVALPERLDDDAIKLSDNLRFWTVTDTLGAYSFRGLPAGEYMIRSSRQGSYQPARVYARTGIDYANLVMARNSEMLVEGRVLGGFGEPIEGVTVFPTLLGQASVQTGVDGRFELPLLVKPGIKLLTLQFQMAGYKDQSSRVQLGSDSEPVTDEVKVVMDMVQSWTSLEGTVTDDEGQPLAGRRVELRPQSGRRAQTTETDSSGRYAFAFVDSPADYRLVVSGSSAFKDVERDIRVTNNGEEVDVVAEAYRFGTVVGRLVNQHGFPVSDFELVLKNVESLKPDAVVRTDSLGNFEVPAAPAGDLVISSVSTPSILVKGLHLEPGELIDISMVLDLGHHAIRGQVVDSLGNPVSASRVILNWSHRDEQLDTYTTRRTATDSQGRFAFSNLGPGPHSLKVDAPGFLGIEIDHDLSQQGYDLTVRLN
jgi:protocatechuate 3,4-dioxygenase beta subunit